MSDSMRPPGKTTIAPDVLITIARLATLGIRGVNRMAKLPPNVNRIFKANIADGVEITVENNTVYADLYVILLRDVNVREVCKAIQSQVARSISEMVGMEVGQVNVHVENIEYSPESGA